jgi:hypothetical protein
LILLVGGGTIADISRHMGRHEASATVTDLQVFDKNDQALQTMDQLVQEDSSDDTPVQPAS